MKTHIATFSTLEELHKWIRMNRNAPQRITINHLTCTADTGTWIVVYGLLNQ